MILLCYDGSADAKAAIERAGELLESQPATVLTVWQPFVAASGFSRAPSTVDFMAVDKASRDSAEQRAEAGAELAQRASLNAQPRTCSQISTVADAILVEADELGASAIVMGSRGLTGLKSLLLGSVSHAVIQHADRPVIVVPSPDVADSRARGRHHRQST